jgi:hypothetical protein
MCFGIIISRRTSGAGSIRSGSLSAEVVGSGDSLPGLGKSGDWDRWINVPPFQNSSR